MLKITWIIKHFFPVLCGVNILYAASHKLQQTFLSLYKGDTISERISCLCLVLKCLLMSEVFLRPCAERRPVVCWLDSWNALLQTWCCDVCFWLRELKLWALIFFRTLDICGWNRRFAPELNPPLKFCWWKCFPPKSRKPFFSRLLQNLMPVRKNL